MEGDWLDRQTPDVQKAIEEVCDKAGTWDADGAVLKAAAELLVAARERVTMLSSVLVNVLASASPSSTEQPTMWAAWQDAHAALTPKVERKFTGIGELERTGYIDAAPTPGGGK